MMVSWNGDPQFSSIYRWWSFRETIPCVFGVDHPMQQISLVVEPPTPLKNMTNRQLGLWNSQLNGKISIHVPNHQPVITIGVLYFLGLKQMPINYINLTFSGWRCNNHLEKYEFVNGKDDIPYMKWKIKVMFQTTNQLWYTIYNGYI